jgi:hypothetical protein
MCKKTNFGAKNKAFHMIMFIFFTWTKKVSVFGETLQMYLDCGYLNAKNLVNFFLHSKICFLDRGSICIQEPN